MPSADRTMRLMDAMGGINACGQGCCTLHVSVAAARQALDVIDRGGCGSMKFGSRQCPACSALIHPEFSEEGLDGGMLHDCETCGGEVCPLPPSGSTPAASDEASPEALARARFPGASTFKIVIDRSDGARLGIDVDFGDGSALLVERVNEGLVEQWNGWNEEAREVRSGDYFVEVNGISGNSKRILAECGENQLLEITVLRSRRRQAISQHHAGEPICLESD